MLKHIVMWKFKEKAQGRTREENMDYVAGMLKKLPGIVDGLLTMEIGKDVLHSDMSYDMALICTFTDEAAMKAYKVHPEHVKVSQYVKLIRDARAVVDFNIQE